MAITRLYQSCPLNVHDIIQLDLEASLRISRVLRAKLSDRLILFNGTGGEYEGIITHIEKKKTIVNIIAFQNKDIESPLHLCLAQAITRSEKMDFIIQKAVELGIETIAPIMTERCNSRMDKTQAEKRLTHWQGIIISACEQSGRNKLPVIKMPVLFQSYIETVNEESCFVLSPHVKNKFIQPSSPPKSMTLLIGPEGGLTNDEMKVAVQRRFVPLNLGPRVLRMETASIAAISIMQFLYGDIGHR